MVIQGQGFAVAAPSRTADPPGAEFLDLILLK